MHNVKFIISTNPLPYTHMDVCVCVYVCVYIYIYVCVCVCVSNAVKQGLSSAICISKRNQVTAMVKVVGG